MIGMTILLTSAALIVDGIVGDPRWLPHPVVLLGRVIRRLDHAWNPYPALERASPLRQRWRGVALSGVMTIATFLAVLIIVYLLSRVSIWLGVAAQVWLISTTIAWRGLIQAANDVYKALERGLAEGRAAVGMIVGRDTDELTEEEVVRACVETLAENITDAVVSPVLYACLGGAPLAMAYRAVNTLDSMVGYRSDRYRNFGWASARLDDVLNYIPGRLTAALMFIALGILRRHPLRAWQTMREDAKKHPSPNSGLPEAMMAGGLGVQLGGMNSYNGVRSERARMGRPLKPLRREDIRLAANVVGVTTAILFMLCVITGCLIYAFGHASRAPIV